MWKDCKYHCYQLFFFVFWLNFQKNFRLSHLFRLHFFCLRYSLIFLLLTSGAQFKQFQFSFVLQQLLLFKCRQIQAINHKEKIEWFIFCNSSNNEVSLRNFTRITILFNTTILFILQNILLIKLFLKMPKNFKKLF